MFTDSGFNRTLCGGAWNSLEGRGAFVGTSNARHGCCAAGEFMEFPMKMFMEVQTKIPKSESCSLCPVGQFGANEPNDDTTCPGTCPPGKSSSTGATQCHNCTAGKYSTAAGTACKNCVAGKSSLPGKTLESDCTACEVGQYSSSGSECASCAAGKQYVNAVTECAICSKGKYRSDVATVLCQDCLVGRYIEDDGNDENQHIECKTCDKGYEIVVADVTQPCAICPFSKVRFRFKGVSFCDILFTHSSFLFLYSCTQ